MGNEKEYKVSDYEDASSYLVKEQTLMDDVVDETRGALSSVSHLFNELETSAVGSSASFYNSVNSNFNENATDILVSSTNTTDILSADHRTSEIGREDALDAQNKQIREEAKVEEDVKMAEETVQEEAECKGINRHFPACL